MKFSQTVLAVLACSALAPLGCAVDASEPAEERIGQSEAALSPASNLGDISLDGKVDSKDALDTLRAFGIRFNTYGVTDDTYTGAGLPRRPYDWRIKVISPTCLDRLYGVSVTAFPPERIPGLVTMARNFLRLPQQYLRELGRQGYTFIIHGDLGRFAKRWNGTQSGQTNQLVFFQTTNGYSGRIRLKTNNVWSDWETLTNVSYNATTGAVAFTRSSVGQVFSGTVNTASNELTTGLSMSGTFTQAGQSRSWSVTAATSGEVGATTSEGGFGQGDLDSCVGDEFEIGKTGPAIAYSVAALSSFNGVHEIGHTIRYMVRDEKVSFNSLDSSLLATRFPGGNASVASGAADIKGSGFIDAYAANNEDEDFAQTFAAYVLNPSWLDSRIAEDVARGSQALSNKKNFIVDRVDTPDPAPQVVTHPNGTVYEFMTRDTIRYQKTGSGPAPLPGDNLSHVAVSAASDGSKLWLFRNGTSNEITYRSINSTGAFGAWQQLGHYTRHPVTATAISSTQMAVFMVGDDQNLYYRLLNTQTGTLGAVGRIDGIQTSQPVGAATLDGKTYLFALNSYGRVYRAILDSSLHTAGFSDMGIAGRHVSAVRAKKPDGTDAVYALVVSDTYRLFYATMNSPSVATWIAEPTQTFMQSAAMNANHDLYVNGFNGVIYKKRLESTGSYTVLTGL